MVTKRWWVVGLLLAVCCGVAQADRAKAKKLTDAAVAKFYNQGEWRKALEAYQKAVAEDPTYARVHYFIASAASIIGDLPVVRRELALVAAAAATDKEAAKLMKLAAKDPDLDRASADPAVRKLLGLPELSTLTPEQRLLERRGLWGTEEQGGGVGSGQWIELTFKKKGKFSYHVSAVMWPDSEDPEATGTGTYKLLPDGSVELRFKPAVWVSSMPSENPGVLRPCPDRPLVCFRAHKESDRWDLHRGVPDREYAESDPF
ncbi:MAG: tetratricopeptide repeat protein [Deltaproteobacteria bacterium]|nr:tetratricopeptide repeat protein [Deltaproteobacteria bacterium]